MIEQDLERVIRQFLFEGRFDSVEELHSGNINHTYQLTYRQNSGDEKRYILQQINTYAFKRPQEVMSNILLVTQHLQRAYERKGLDSNRRVLKLIPTLENGWMYRSEEDHFWRAYEYISDAFAYDRPERPEHFMEAGRAFGNFQKMLFDFPAEQLYETIVDFHNTPKRFRDFEAAVKADRVGRVKGLEREIDFFFQRQAMMSKVVEMINSGEMPLRVTHNDTKMNNVMLDAKTGEGLCVIDLDTVMPGSVLYDYGDAIRFGASTAAEDEADTSKIHLDMDLFRAFTQGFVAEVKDALTPVELELLPFGIKLMTCELAMRFFTDYIDGDRYFIVRSREHNLIRARAQMKLLEDVEDKFDDLSSVMEKLIRK